MSTGLTLFDIETDLLNLMLCREAVLDDEQYHGDEASRTEALEMIDCSIKERVSAEIAKVDGIAFYLREFAARAATAKAEKDRLAARQRLWEAREERLKEIVKNVMLMTGKDRLEGDSNTLKLVRNPPSVEIAQPELVPAEYRQVKVPMSEAMWNRLVNVLFAHDRELWQMFANRGQPNLTDFEPMKTPIKEALKQQIPCGRCDGTSIESVPMELRGPNDSGMKKCTQCNGTGKVNQGVPGCSLVRDKMRLEVE
jgi:hypothetical protein